MGLPDFNYTNEKPDAAVGLALLNHRQLEDFLAPCSIPAAYE